MNGTNSNLQNPLDERIYVEAEVERQLETAISTDADETLDQEVLDMIGEIKDPT